MHCIQKHSTAGSETSCTMYQLTDKRTDGRKVTVEAATGSLKIRKGKQKIKGKKNKKLGNVSYIYKYI